MEHETFQKEHWNVELLEYYHQTEESHKPIHIILHLNSENNNVTS